MALRKSEEKDDALSIGRKRVGWPMTIVSLSQEKSLIDTPLYSPIGILYT